MDDPAEAVFTLLEHAGTPTDLRIRHSTTSVPAGAVALGIDTAGRRHLLVPLNPDQHPVEDHGSRGVAVLTRDLSGVGGTQRYVDVVCELNELRDLFAVVVDEITERLDASTAQPGHVCLTVLDRWRELLSPASGPLLGSHRLAGLLAELHVMELIVAVDPARAVSLWTGPDAARADFTAAHCAIEVKATTQRDKIRVEIHGIRQLEERPGTRLYLYAEQLERDDTGGDTVPAAVSRLLDAGVPRKPLLDSLADVGYHISDAAAYRLFGFRIVTTRAYEVSTSAFPRIIPTSLGQAAVLDHITDVRYYLDLAAIVDPAIDPSTMIDDLTGAS